VSEPVTSWLSRNVHAP